MTVEQWQTLSFIAFILAGVFLTAAVILFFVFRIPRIVGYLTGRTAKKTIAQIAANNGNMEEDAKEIQEQYNMNFQQSESGRLASVTETLDLTETVLLRPEKEAEETILLGNTEEAEETTLLRNTEKVEETTLLETAGETTLLQDQAEETTELYLKEPPARSEDRIAQTEFQLIRNIIFVHSEDVI